MQVSGRKIVVLGTGGTISGRAASARDNVGYVAGEVPVDALLEGVQVPPGCSVVAEQVAQVDSKDMSFAVWEALAQRCTHWLQEDSVRGIVVTHGTDTMEETAYLLHCILHARKPVVLTGAMRPASSDEPDGPRNLGDALAVAASATRGVYVVFAGAIHSPLDVYKAHSSDLDAFDSGEAGPLGVVESGSVRVLRQPPHPGDPIELLGEWPRVEIVLNYAGATGAIVEALVAQGVRGLVAAGTGNGTLASGLEAALLAARNQGVAVVRSSRCPEGGVIPHARDTLPDAGELSPVKARVALMLDLMQPGPAGPAA
jgi:L-asparaginase